VHVFRLVTIASIEKEPIGTASEHGGHCFIVGSPAVSSNINGLMNSHARFPSTSFHPPSNRVTREAGSLRAGRGWCRHDHRWRQQNVLCRLRPGENLQPPCWPAFHPRPARTPAEPPSAAAPPTVTLKTRLASPATGLLERRI
jgi:hypothetical protein